MGPLRPSGRRSASSASSGSGDGRPRSRRSSLATAMPWRAACSPRYRAERRARTSHLRRRRRDISAPPNRPSPTTRHRDRQFAAAATEVTAVCSAALWGCSGDIREPGCGGDHIGLMRDIGHFATWNSPRRRNARTDLIAATGSSCRVTADKAWTPTPAAVGCPAGCHRPAAPPPRGRASATRWRTGSIPGWSPGDEPPPTRRAAVADTREWRRERR